MEIDSSNYFNPKIYEKNAEINLKFVETSINELKFDSDKFLVCGRGSDFHPDFSPKFSTPTTNIDSELYCTVDHDPKYVNYITRKGNYALSLIVDPLVPNKILELGGKIFWFSPDYFNNDLPKINSGDFPIGNSGLTLFSLASFFGAKFILSSGITLTGDYSQFLPSKDLIFDKIIQKNCDIYSLDGKLSKQISFTTWCEL